MRPTGLDCYVGRWLVVLSCSMNPPLSSRSSRLSTVIVNGENFLRRPITWPSAFNLVREKLHAHTPTLTKTKMNGTSRGPFRIQGARFVIYILFVVSCRTPRKSFFCWNGKFFANYNFIRATWKKLVYKKRLRGSMFALVRWYIILVMEQKPPSVQGLIHQIRLHQRHEEGSVGEVGEGAKRYAAGWAVAASNKKSFLGYSSGDVPSKSFIIYYVQELILMGTTFYGLAEGRSKCSAQAILYFHAPPDDVHSLLPTKEMDNSSTTKTTFVKSLTIRGKRGKYVPVCWCTRAVNRI